MVTSLSVEADQGCNATAASWKDRDGSIVMLVAECSNKDGLPCTYAFSFTALLNAHLAAPIILLDISPTRSILGQHTNPSP